MTTEPFVLALFVNALGVAGIVVWHIQGRSRPTQRLFAQIAFFILMSLAIQFAGIIPFRFEVPHFRGSGLFILSAKILWWTHLAWATIGFIRIYVVLDRRPQEARLLQDLVVAVVYLGVLLSILSFVFGVPIGGLLATSGVVAIILGLALQNTLSDVFSGIALTLGRTYAIGDWIMLSDGSEGRVIASNWRASYLLNSSNNVVILPNSFLAKQGLTNISKPDENHQIVLDVRILPTTAPQFISEVLNEAVRSSNSCVQEPPPTVSLIGISSVAIDVQLLFRVSSPSKRVTVRNEMIDLVYRHCRANGLQLAAPLCTQFIQHIAGQAEPSALAMIEKVGRFASLSPEEQNKLAASMVLKRVEKDEAIAYGLSIIRTGVVEILDVEGHPRRLAPGDLIEIEPLMSPQARSLTGVTLFVADSMASPTQGIV